MPGHFNLKSRTVGVHPRSVQTSSKHTSPAGLFCSASTETQPLICPADKMIRIPWIDVHNHVPKDGEFRLIENTQSTYHTATACIRLNAKSSQGGSAQGFTNNHLISMLKILRWQLHHKYSVSQPSSLTQETWFPNCGFLSCCQSTVPHTSPNSPCVGEDGTIHSREPLMSAGRGAIEQSSKRDKTKLRIPLGTEISCSVLLTKPQSNQKLALPFFHSS